MAKAIIKGGLYKSASGKWVNANGNPVDVEDIEDNNIRKHLGLKQKRDNGKKTEGQGAAK